ncbi:hypothetical protein T11_6352 [Trichinella zimbabwensis]|uniref:Uncharacterized protein n=1 Tax=Trichinella zimbabwensis TaxID=268475 RepID=A0A0V1GMH4_9BILA|nr:hypothetical protein T11_6352 [Trichinella zimbabwensis]
MGCRILAVFQLTWKIVRNDFLAACNTMKLLLRMKMEVYHFVAKLCFTIYTSRGAPR